jgi:type I restriction enzyme S subunit
MQTLQKYKKTELGKIPEEWSIVQIQDICKTSSGGTPSRNNSNYYKGDIPWLKTGELKDGYIFETEEHISEEALKFSSAKLFPPDTVLFAMYGATIGKTAITKISTTTNQACCAFLPLKKEIIDPYFLQQYFILVRPKIISKGEGAGQPNTSQDFLKTFRIIYPPFQEQQKIASILSKVDELIQKIEHIIELTKRLKKGLMQRLLTKGIGHTKFKKVRIGFQNIIKEYPDSWKIVKLGEIAKIERGKFTHRPRNDPTYYGGNYPFIQTGDIENSDGYIKKYSQTLNEKGIAISKLFPKDIIVITIAANIGSTAITTFPVYFPDSVVGISTSKMNIKFLEYFLRTRKRFLQSSASVNARSNINLQTLNPLLIPVPPIEEQNQISSILLGMDNLILHSKTEKIKLEKLKKGLMQRLLTGKIRIKV